MTSALIKAISWNFLNIILYKIILQAHQIALYYTISNQLFGLVGTIFATIYFFINITNFGFDYTIITHHQTHIASRQHFHQLYNLLKYRVLCIAGVTLLLATLFVVVHPAWLNPQLSSIPKTIWYILAGICITESLKKSLDVIAQMSMLQKSTTMIDLIFLILYVATIWGQYLIYGTIAITSIFIAMLIASTLECLVLAKRIHQYYQTLPWANSTTTLPSYQAILKHQAYNYVNQITKSLFSPNFFIILIAFYINISTAGYVKLCTDITMVIYMLLSRGFSMPTAAVLSSLKNQDPQIFKEHFLKITTWYMQIVYILASMITIGLFSCLTFQTCLSPVITATIIMFITSGILEYLSIMYEKLYLIQHRSACLTRINIISLIPYLLYILYAQHVPMQHLLVPIVVIRSCSIIILMWQTYIIWNIQPPYKLHPLTAKIIAIITAIWYLWFVA